MNLRFGSYVFIFVLVAGLVATTPACAGASPPKGGPAASATVTPSGSPTPPPRAVCPNEHGGACLGELVGGEYSTRSFIPTLTYTVTDGWSNFEDLRGNFLLVPPGDDLAGVDRGTSDYIGVYTRVNPIEGCEATQVDVPHTPQGFIDWLQGHSGFDVADVAEASVGGLDGFVADLRMADGWDLVCPYSRGRPVLPLMIGVRPSELEHALTQLQSTRLWLLSFEGGVLAIELSDVDPADGAAELSAVVDSFAFST
jgi:hypothetical protein